MIGTLIAAALLPALADNRTLFTLQDPAITESSAVVEVHRPHRVLTINDSGDGAVVYVLDPATGRTVGRSTYSGDAVDVEALTRGRDGEVWVGDIGDNGAVRAGIQVYRLPRLTDGDREVTSTRYDLAFRGGARDAEALLVHPRTGQVYVVSKSLFGGQVFAAPERLSSDRPNVLRPLGRVPGLITDGAFFPDGRHAVLRDYSRAYVFDTTTTPWRRLDSVELPNQPQGEGIDVRASGRSLLVSTEGANEPVEVVALPRRVLAELAPAAASPSASAEDPADRSRLDALTQEGAVPWTLVGAVVGVCLLVGLVLRVARRRSRSTG